MTEKNIEVREMPSYSRPREKLFRHGVAHLSDKELIAIILRSGVKGKGVSSLSAEVLNQLEYVNYQVDKAALNKILGLGKAKIASLSASIEFARRILCPAVKKIKTPGDIFPYIQHYADRKQEIFLCAALNGAYEIISIRIVSIGLVNRALVHPREVFADPLSDRASAIIICHNHPSGNLTPSSEDIDVTKRLEAAGEILGIRLLDHIIFSHSKYKSIIED